MRGLLYTLNTKTLYSSLAYITGVNETDVRYYVSMNHIKLSSEHVDNISVEDFLGFLRKTNPNATIDFDEVTISHLTSRINNNDLENKPLHNLFNALTHESDISNFLRSQGIVCEEQNGKIIVKQKGEVVDWSKFLKGYESPAARMVINRLEGNSMGVTDKCVNGFLFNTDIHMNSNTDHLCNIPEILEHILRLLNKSNVANEWIKRSKTYIITFKVGLNDVVFDSADKLNNKQKRYQIIRNCLFFLSEMLVDNWEEYDNPIMRLKDELNVSPQQIIDVRTV